MLATLQRLGVVPSFSRPSVSDDNPYSEALFRTLKYCPEYPSAGFATVADARAWVARFVAWYNHEHQHSGIGYVAPADRHDGKDVAILAARKAVYERACDRHPERWARHTRAWDRPTTVTLNQGALLGFRVLVTSTCTRHTEGATTYSVWDVDAFAQWSNFGAADYASRRVLSRYSTAP